MLIAAPSSAAAYSVLAHEAIIDAMWQPQLAPILKQKFPRVSGGELAGHYLRGHVFFFCRAYDQAIQQFERAEGLGKTSAKGRGFLGYACARVGRVDDARRMLEWLKNVDLRATPFYAAAVHAALGETDQAFECLDRLYESGDGRIAHLKFHNALDPLRSDPRFAVLLKRVGLPE